MGAVYDNPTVAGWSTKSWQQLDIVIANKGMQTYHIAHVAPGMGVVEYISVVINSAGA